MSAATALAGCVDLSVPARVACPGAGCVADGGSDAAAAPMRAAPDAAGEPGATAGAERPVPDGAQPPRPGPEPAAVDASVPTDTPPPPPPDASIARPPDAPPPPPPDAAPPPPPDAPPPAPDTAPVTSDPSRFGFERDTQGWTWLRGQNASTARSTAVAFAGTSALEVGLDFTTNVMESFHGVIGDMVASPPVVGSVVTYHFWVPVGHGLMMAQPYVLYQPPGTVAGKWAGTPQWLADKTGGQWFTINVTVPADYVRLYEIGVQWIPARAWAGKVYVDAVNW
jgi:hypothetical protein